MQRSSLDWSDLKIRSRVIRVKRDRYENKSLSVTDEYIRDKMNMHTYLLSTQKIPYFHIQLG